MRFVATLQPARATFNGELHARGGSFCACAWRTIIKGHDDVGANIILRLNASLGRDANARAVNKRFKRDSVVVDVADGGHGKSLKATGVRQYGSAPAHEIMRAAKKRDALVTGAQHKVQSVIENALATRGANLRWCKSLHCGGGGHGHERGCLHFAMRGFDHAQSCVIFSGFVQN